MANMDYPGPCPSCGGIDGCGAGVSAQEATARYCQGLETELNAWKAHLYDVLVQVGELDVTHQEQLDDTLTLIKSTVKELENLRGQMLEVCPSDLADATSEIENRLQALHVHASKAQQALSPGWFGG